MALPLSNWWYLRHYNEFNFSSVGPFVRADTNMTKIRENICMLVLDLGAYGQTWTLASKSCSEPECMVLAAGVAAECTGVAAFQGLFEIEEKIENGAYDRLNFDEASESMYLVAGSLWISYDNERIYRIKNEHSKKECMRGAMMRSVDMNKKNPLPATEKGRRAQGGDAAVLFA